MKQERTDGYRKARHAWLREAAADLDAGRITRRQYESVVRRVARADELDMLGAD